MLGRTLMLLVELISASKKGRKKVKQQHTILQAYQKQNPWVVLSVLQQMAEEGIDNIPTFDEVISLKEEYILDDLGKVFHQIKKHNPLLITGPELEKVYFYTVKDGLYTSQLKKGFALGEKDNQGRLVTGSDLMIDIASINLKEFLDMYYIKHN